MVLALQKDQYWERAVLKESLLRQVNLHLRQVNLHLRELRHHLANHHLRELRHHLRELRHHLRELRHHLRVRRQMPWNYISIRMLRMQQVELSVLYLREISQLPLSLGAKARIKNIFNFER